MAGPILSSARIGRRSFLGGAAALALLRPGIAKAQTESASVRFINAIAASGRMQLLAGGVRIGPPVPYGQATCFNRTDAAAQALSVISVLPPVSLLPPQEWKQSVELRSGSISTVVASGSLLGGAVELQVFDDDRTPPALGQTKLRFINASRVSLAFVSFAGAWTTGELNPGETTNYIDFKPGIQSLDLSRAESPIPVKPRMLRGGCSSVSRPMVLELARDGVDLMEGSLWTAVAIGSLARDPYLEIVMFADDAVPVVDDVVTREHRDPAVPIEVAPGEFFTIVLESNRAIGFRWRLNDGLNEEIVRLDSSEYVAPVGGAPGSTGTERWTFQAAGAGSTPIAMTYARDSGPGAAGNTSIFQVNVQ